VLGVLAVLRNISFDDTSNACAFSVTGIVDNGSQCRVVFPNMQVPETRPSMKLFCEAIMELTLVCRESFSATTPEAGTFTAMHTREDRVMITDGLCVLL
jgi:hypothetical protein